VLVLLALGADALGALNPALQRGADLLAAMGHLALHVAQQRPEDRALAPQRAARSPGGLAPVSRTVFGLVFKPGFSAQTILLLAITTAHY
jgi:hypothetical protein